MAKIVSLGIIVLILGRLFEDPYGWDDFKDLHANEVCSKEFDDGLFGGEKANDIDGVAMV